jgi:hypothetical protein
MTTLQQTVEIPASHRLTLDLPQDIPAGSSARVDIIVYADRAAQTAPKHKTFHYIGIDMTGFKFDREEANAR